MQSHGQNSDLIQAYEQLLVTKDKLEDRSQRQAIEQLNPIYQYLTKPQQTRWYFSQSLTNKPKGVYLWGQAIKYIVINIKKLINDVLK